MRDEVMKIIGEARKEDRKWLLEPEAKEICKLYNIPVPNFKIARSLEEAKAIAEELGYPVVMKVVSPNVLHKSDVGGVMVNLKGSRDLEEAYEKILENIKRNVGDVDLKGFLVEKMAPPSTEVIIGMIRDLQFGPVIMFGLGGIFVEIFKDVSFRIAPLDRDDAEEMIKEIKAYPILEGVRGREPADINKLIDIIMKVSNLVMDIDDIKELDLNPVFAYRDGALVVDARIILT